MKLAAICIWTALINEPFKFFIVQLKVNKMLVFTEMLSVSRKREWPKKEMLAVRAFPFLEYNSTTTARLYFD
jgi:hypothetical protein